MSLSTQELDQLPPRDLEQNLKWRRDLLEWCHGSDPEALRRQAAVRRACERSILFFVNSFCWTYNPRLTRCPKIPFTTWRYQDDGFRDLVDAVDQQTDRCIEKSRDMGASWMCLVLFLWFFLFRRNVTFLLMSRTSDLVDKAGDPDSLFWKLDMCRKSLPSWLVPPVRRIEMHLENLENGSTIDGATTTGEAGVGGRRTAALFDEFSLVPQAERVWMQSADLTGCRIFNGTPDGTRNTYYRITKMPAIKKLRFHWTLSPEKTRGLKLDARGKPTSPWYESECARRGHNKRQIAAQLDIDYEASSYQFFDGDEIDRLIRTVCCPPSQIGDLTARSPDLTVVPQFCPTLSGNLRIWMPLSHRPVADEYVVACDIATGSGGDRATNSVASVYQRRTGIKVAELASPHLTPDQFSEHVFRLGIWFHQAVVVWEDAGPGASFRRRLLDLGYSRLWYRSDERLAFKGSEKIEPGWYPTREGKLILLTEYRRALSSGECTNRHELSLDECKMFVYSSEGGVVHEGELDADDPSRAKSNHGDRVIADALGWKLCREWSQEKPQVQQNEDGPPVGSFLERRERRQQREKEEELW